MCFTYRYLHIHRDKKKYNSHFNNNRITSQEKIMLTILEETSFQEMQPSRAKINVPKQSCKKYE